MLRNIVRQCESFPKITSTQVQSADEERFCHL